MTAQKVCNEEMTILSVSCALVGSNMLRAGLYETRADQRQGEVMATEVCVHEICEALYRSLHLFGLGVMWLLPTPKGLLDHHTHILIRVLWCNGKMKRNKKELNLYGS